MGKNKLAKFADMASFPHVFQFSSEQLRKTCTFEMRGSWRQNFFRNDHPIVLELGCGKGEYTVQMAKLFPDKNFIGVDIKGARMWTGAKESFEQGLENLAFLRSDIGMIEHFFSEGEVNEIWLTFPDPQMKKTNKRLTSTNFLRKYQKILLPGGRIHLKTDSNFMFVYTSETVKLNKYPVEFATDDLYALNLINNPVLEIKTYYERQWLQRGLTIKYICFLLEPRSEFFEPNLEIERDSYRSFGRNRRTL